MNVWTSSAARTTVAWDFCSITNCQSRAGHAAVGTESRKSFSVRGSPATAQRFNKSHAAGTSLMALVPVNKHGPTKYPAGSGSAGTPVSGSLTVPSAICRTRSTDFFLISNRQSSGTAKRSRRDAMLIGPAAACFVSHPSNSDFAALRSFLSSLSTRYLASVSRSSPRNT